MGITEHVNELRKRPHHEKKRIALAYSGVITGAIFIVWLSVLLPRGLKRDLATAAPDSSGGTSLNEINGEMQQGASGIQAQFNAAAQQFGSAYGESETAAAGSALSASAPDGESAGTGLYGGEPAGSPAAAGGSDGSAAADAATSSEPAKQYDFGY